MGSERTAIKRFKPSKPVEFLVKNSFLNGRLLDYGSGRGFDANYLGADEYDSYWAPKQPEGLYDTIICIYVLNVIESEKERHEVLKRIQSLLTPTGTAYIAVRTDTCDLHGHTSRGTFQTLVTLGLTKVATQPRFKVYKLDKADALEPS